MKRVDIAEKERNTDAEVERKDREGSVGQGGARPGCLGVIGQQHQPNTGVDLGGIPLSRAPQILRRNTRFAGTVIRPDYQLLPRFGEPILGLASLD